MVLNYIEYFIIEWSNICFSYSPLQGFYHLDVNLLDSLCYVPAKESTRQWKTGKLYICNMKKLITENAVSWERLKTPHPNLSYSFPVFHWTPSPPIFLPLRKKSNKSSILLMPAKLNQAFVRIYVFTHSFRRKQTCFLGKFGKLRWIRELAQTCKFGTELAVWRRNILNPKWPPSSFGMRVSLVQWCSLVACCIAFWLLCRRSFVARSLLVVLHG